MVQCECGRELEVSPGPAWGSVACPCGRRVDVPPAGDVIHGQLARGVLAQGARPRRLGPAGEGWSVAGLTALLLLGGAAVVLALLGLCAFWGWLADLPRK
jgi:hypothetical protein